MAGKVGKGVFQIHRLLQKRAAIFPNGYKTVTENFLRLSKLIQKRPETAKFGNFRLELEYNKGWYKKYTPQELANNLLRLDVKPPGGIYLDLHCTYNENSNSTPFRLLVDPKRPRWLLGDVEARCSYNDLVTIPKYGLISPFQFNTRQMLYAGVAGMDISTAFRTIQHSEATMLHNLTVFYEGKNGQPLLTPDQAKIDENGEPVLTTYAFASLLFGIKDAPSLLGIALGQAVAVWTKYEDKMERKKYFSHVLSKVNDLLTKPYVDDLLLGGLPWEVVDHLIRSCPLCTWCETCTAGTLNNARNLQHNDMCPLYALENDLKESLKPKARDTCGCVICPGCEFWQNWVRPGSGGVINFETIQEYNKYLIWFDTEYMNYMCLTLKYLLMILNFSGFTTKGIETQHDQLRETYKKCIPPAEATSDVLWAPPPDVPGVISESQDITIKKNDKRKAWPPCKDQKVPEELKVVFSQTIEDFKENGGLQESEKTEVKFMTQMAKCIFSVPGKSNADRIRCRADGLEIESLRLYRNSGSLKTFGAFGQYMKEHGYVVTRRFVSSFTGLLFDIGNSTTNTLVALIFIKRAHHHLYLLPGVTVPEEDVKQSEDQQDGQEPRVQAQGKALMPDWDEPVPPMCRLLLFKAAQAFYLLKDRRVSRCNVIQHCAVGRMLVSMADSSIELSAERIFLVTYYYVNGKYRATNQCLHNLILINRPDLVSMPVKEGIALYKLVLSLADVIQTLGEMGLAVPSDHVSLITDSHTTLILLRSISSYGIFQNKLKHLAAKTYAVLIALYVNVMRSMYSFDQGNEEGILFPPDILTKASEKMTPAAMLTRADQILNLPWLNRHPSLWPISRQIRESQANSFIGGDLLIDEAYRARLQQEVQYQQEICVGRVAEPLKRPPNQNFGLTIMSRQSRQITSVDKSLHEDRKTFFVNLIKYRFSNILYEDSRSPQFRKVSLVGVLSLVVFWATRLRAKAKTTKEANYYKDRKKIFDNGRNVSKSNWCGFLLCTSKERCRHPTSGFGGRLNDGDGGLYVRQDGPHAIHHDKKIWGLTSKETDSLFAQPTPELALNASHQGCSSYLQDRIHCSDQECILCKEPRDIKSIHDFLGFLSDNVQQPAGGAAHWEWAKHCIQLASHFAFHPLFRGILSERILDLLAGAFPAKESMIDGMSLNHCEYEGGFCMAITGSREIRNLRQVECPEMMGRVMWRGISSKSHLATSLIFQLHSSTHHVGTYAVRFKLLGVGLLCNSVHQIATQAAAGCQVCYLDAIRRGRESKLPKMSEKVGPLDLATIVDLKKGAPPTMICGDSIGPIKIICPCKANNVIQVHIMVYVDVFTLHVRYHILYDMTTGEVLRDLIDLIATIGPVEALVFDPSSIFRHFASTLGPVEVPQDENMHTILKRLNKRQGTKLWTRILHDQYVKNKLPPRLHVKVSPTAGSWLQGRCEERVRQLKITLSQHKIFGLNVSPTITLSDLKLHLAIAADVANNLPALAIGKRIFLSSNDLSSMAGRIGFGKANFPDFLEGGGQDGPQLLRCISDTNKLASVIRSSIWALHLSRLQQNANWKGQTRHGDYTDRIMRGTVCIDLKRVNVFKTLHQSMGRVEFVSKGRRWVLLSIIVPKNIDINLRRELFSCTKHKIVGCEPCVRMVLKKSPTACTLVTRHVSHVYPIFNPESEELKTFCPRWIFPSLWHYEMNDFVGGLFLNDRIDGDILREYEKELEKLAERGEEDIENIDT